MSEKDFIMTLKIFEFAAAGIRNDASLGDFLVKLGSELVALGVQENQRAREATK